MWEAKTSGRIDRLFFVVVDIRDVITCFKFGDDRFRGLALAEGQILPFPIDFDGRPYNTLTLPCERVIQPELWQFKILSKFPHRRHYKFFRF